MRRKPLLPGSDTKNQLELIFELIGTPEDSDLNQVQREKLKKIIKNMPTTSGKMDKLFPKASQQSMDLLTKMLTFNPKKRITVDEALAHPYLSELHFIEDEPTRDAVNKLEFEFEDHQLTLQQLKDSIYEEILLYHYPEFIDNYEEKKKKGESVFQHIISNENQYYNDSDEDEEEYSSEDY